MKKRNAITLMELIIVVVILGIVVSIAVPVYRDVVTRAEVSDVISNLRAIYAAQKIFYLRNGAYHLNTSNVTTINNDLHLDLVERNWDYSIADNPGSAPAYLGRAVHLTSPVITFTVEGDGSVNAGEPYCYLPVGCQY